ncbi:APC family permease [Actinokineospora spheciospongiae]|uniref:APC family permease n=1 Tax=Actinokineospora spheciospongiae TaxID=909613 RepID=UPI000D70BA93|nr:APC family permease [Actinokineospora spheciospongiae]PWW56181.1 amino acid efflux transporter [Actinokineospora spheciospongiae]
MEKLKQSMGGFVGTFVALSTILGSGMMILPGMSYHRLDTAAWQPWALAALSVVPLLYCYAWLGRRHPAASGVAHYAEVALGKPVGRTSGMLAALALVTGIPATAITGGFYLAEFSGIGVLAWVFPLLVLVGATFVAAAGASFSGRLQVGLILALFALILATAVAAIGEHGPRPPALEVPGIGALGSVLTAVYVAFTGWETVAFTFEEHKRSDLIPRIFAASYVIVIALYGLLLLGLFAAVDPGEDALESAPLLVLADRAFGDLGRPAAAVLVVACITANVCASVLALSRLVFGMARSGFLPAALSRVRAHDRNPITAVVAVGCVLTVIAVLGAMDLFPFEFLFILSGGVYFVLYGVGAAAFTRLASGPSRVAVGAVCAVVVVGVTVIAGPSMWLSWAVFAVTLLVVVLVARFSRRAAVATPAADDTTPALHETTREKT